MRLRNMTAIYLTRGSQLLMLYRVGSRVVGNSYTGTAGGHFEPEELNDPQRCVLRELEEETGLTPDALSDLRMRYVTLRLKNGEIRQNYYFFAGLKEGFEPESSTEGSLEWVDRNRVLELPMPVSAWHMLRHYLEQGCHTTALYAGETTEHGIAFTELKEF